MTDPHDKWEEITAAIRREQREEWHEPTYGRSYPMKKQKPLSPADRGVWPSGWWVLPVALGGGLIWLLILFIIF